MIYIFKILIGIVGLLIMAVVYAIYFLYNFIFYFRIKTVKNFISDLDDLYEPNYHGTNPDGFD